MTGNGLVTGVTAAGREARLVGRRG